MATDIFRLEATGLRCQLVLTLREVDKLTFARIGQRLGVSRKRAEQIYHKAVRILRDERRREAPYIIVALTSVLEKTAENKI